MSADALVFAHMPCSYSINALVKVPVYLGIIGIIDSTSTAHPPFSYRTICGQAWQDAVWERVRCVMVLAPLHILFHIIFLGPERYRPGNFRYSTHCPECYLEWRAARQCKDGQRNGFIHYHVFTTLLYISPCTSLLCLENSAWPISFPLYLHSWSRFLKMSSPYEFVLLDLRQQCDRPFPKSRRNLLPTRYGI